MYSPEETFSFFIEFRTYDCNGILLYTAGETATDFAALELKAGSVSCTLHRNEDTGTLLDLFLRAFHPVLHIFFANGQLQFSFSNGDPQPTLVTFTPNFQEMLCDGSWHMATINKMALVATLTVDAYTPVSGSSSSSSYFSVDTRAPLYAAGVPSEFKSSDFPLKKHNQMLNLLHGIKLFFYSGTVQLVPSVTFDLFWGCISVVQVSDSNGDLITLSFSQASESSNMVLSSCVL